MPDYSQQIRDDWARQAAAAGRPLAVDPTTGRYTSLKAFQTANPTDPYGGRAPQKLSDFQIGANGLPMVVTPADAFGPAKVRYFPKEYFDAGGTYIGPNPNSPDWQASGNYFQHPLQWNYSEGKFERPTNWQHVVGTAMAAGGGVAGLAQAGAFGGAGAASTAGGVGGGVGLGETGAVTGLAGSGFGTGAGLGYTAIAPSVGEVLAGGTAVPTVGATTGLASGATLPGATEIPTVADLATSSSSIAGVDGLPAAGGTGSGLLKGLAGSGAVTPLINAGAGLISTTMQTSANEDAAAQQAAATKYAADLKAKADAESLAWLKQQGAYNAMVAESTRAANYGQWAAKQQQLGSVGQALGLPGRVIPAYVPLPPDASLAPPAPPGTAPPAPSQSTAPPTIGVTDPGQSGRVTTAAASPPDGSAPNPAAWWNPQDPRGSVASLFAGAAPTSQAILDRKAQIEAAGGQISPANAEGVISKIYVPGVGWTRVLDGGTAGGPGGATGTGWTFVPQGGGAPTRTSAQTLNAPADPFGSVGQYLLDPTKAGGTLTLPRYQAFGQPGGPVGSYL